MNNTTLTGRLTRNPEVRHNAGSNGKLSVAKYTLAVRRPRAKGGQPTADFIRCTAFGPKATFAENYLAKGMKIEVSGNIRTAFNYSQVQKPVGMTMHRYFTYTKQALQDLEKYTSIPQDQLKGMAYAEVIHGIEKRYSREDMHCIPSEQAWQAQRFCPTIRCCHDSSSCYT